MGQIADDMLDGTTCCLCGMFFADPENPKELFVHGYPVVCKDCWQDLSKKERKNYQLAIADTFCGEDDED